jgi:alkanesulfonate monooxygenase SsuD/methylene tetrahydromethanopterin reductase-like flavin-dependent oxidoreductase (luciferase family)
MKIGVSMFLTEKTGNPGAIAREAENLGFDSFWVAEHLVMPVTYSTWYPRGKVALQPVSVEGPVPSHPNTEGDTVEA